MYRMVGLLAFKMLMHSEQRSGFECFTAFLVLQLLWSFCYSQLEEAVSRPFHLTQAIPGASQNLDYDRELTFEESGLANSMISVTWE